MCLVSGGVQTECVVSGGVQTECGWSQGEYRLNGCPVLGSWYIDGPPNTPGSLVCIRTDVTLGARLIRSSQAAHNVHGLSHHGGNSDLHSCLVWVSRALEALVLSEAPHSLNCILDGYSNEFHLMWVPHNSF